MHCTFFVQCDGRLPHKIGPVPVKDVAEVGRLAQIEFDRSADALSIDAWLDDGELFRIDRRASPSGPIKLHAAQKPPAGF